MIKFRCWSGKLLSMKIVRAEHLKANTMCGNYPKRSLTQTNSIKPNIFLPRNKTQNTCHHNVWICYENHFFCQHMQTRYIAYQFNTVWIIRFVTQMVTYKLKEACSLMIESVYFCNWIYLRNVLFDNNAKRFPVKNPLCLQRFLQIVSYFDFVRFEIDSVEISVCRSVSLCWCCCHCAHPTHLASNLIFQCTFSADSTSSLDCNCCWWWGDDVVATVVANVVVVVVVVVVELCIYFIGVKCWRSSPSQFPSI